MKPTTDTTELLQSRAILYAGISAVFTSPVEKKFQSLRNGEFRNQIKDAAGLYDEFLGNDRERVQNHVAAMLDSFHKEQNILEYEYINIFGHTLSKKTSPYELEHLQNQEIFYKTQSLADISGFYKAFGLQVGAKERVDFISVEAEFLSYLIVKELLAHQKNLGVEKIDVTRKAQRDFFNDHFAGWTTQFAKNVIAHANISFYHNAGKYLQQFIDNEKTYFKEDET